MPFTNLTYVEDHHNRVQRVVIRTVEATVDRERCEALYAYWRDLLVAGVDHAFTRMLELVDIRLVHRGEWPPKDLPEGPIVIVANHPFGIGDGIAALSLAEQLNRPFKVMINNALLKVPEIRDYALPVHFEENKEALAANIAMRKDAVAFLRQGGTIVVFPAGGVATAPRGWGKAVDLPWKLFPASLIQKSGATVIPVHFDGQNGWLFHLASRFSMTLRLSLLVREFARLSGRAISARVGRPISPQTLAAYADKRALTDFLRDQVFQLR